MYESSGENTMNTSCLACMCRETASSDWAGEVTEVESLDILYMLCVLCVLYLRPFFTVVLAAAGAFVSPSLGGFPHLFFPLPSSSPSPF